MRSERRTDAGPEGRGSDFQFHPSETLCEPRGELKPRSRWSGIRTSPIKGDGRIRTELAPLGRGDQALLGSTFVSPSFVINPTNPSYSPKLKAVGNGMGYG